MASLWKLPVIFICQNNLIAEHTRYEVGTAAESVASRAAAYSMPGVRVNGNDPAEMWAACKEAVARARRGDGPTLIEAMTFRFMGHLIGDPDEHWAPGEKEAAIEVDPVPVLRQKLLDDGYADLKKIEGIEAAVDAEIKDAMAFAVESAHPDISELDVDVLAEGAGMMAQCNFVEAINWALEDALEADPNVLLLGEDVGDKEGGGVVKVTQGLSTKFGTDRVKSTPIAEEAIMGAAIGAALVGKRPIAEIMLMNFMTVAMDQLVNHAAKLRFMSGGQTTVPITVRTMTGAGGGGGGQHTDYLEAWFAHVAGMKVVIPSTPADAYGLLRACIDDDDPCLFVENLPTYWTAGEAPNRGTILPLGKANVEREGSDATLISYGRTMMEARAASDALASEGVNVELIDLRTVAPFDAGTVLASAAKTKRAVVAHEAVKPFGVGAEISAQITEALFGELAAPVGRVGSTFNAVPYSQALETAHLPSSKKIVDAVKATLN